MSGTLHLLARLGGQAIAVPAEMVESVVDIDAVVPAPRSHPAVRGLAALRSRDGDNCKRCKRAMRFDLPDGHESMPKVEQIVPQPAGGLEDHSNLCLTHDRSNAKHGCDTAEVKERARIKNEAALFEKSKRTRKRA